ncbi:MAG: ankyrin repeat domain-containing protein [Thermodesulfobacteriota bacterium]
MAMRHVKISQFVDDVRSGMTDFELMEKHCLSLRQLQSVFDKLLAAGTLDPIDLEGIEPELDPTVKLTGPCPSCGRPMLSSADICPSCGLDNPITEIKELMPSGETIEEPPREGVADLEKSQVAELMDIEALAGTFIPDEMEKEGPAGTSIADEIEKEVSEPLQVLPVHSSAVSLRDFPVPEEAPRSRLRQKLPVNRKVLIGASMVGVAVIVLLVGLYAGTLIFSSDRVASPGSNVEKPSQGLVTPEKVKETPPPANPTPPDQPSVSVAEAPPEPRPTPSGTERIAARPQTSPPVAVPPVVQDPQPSRQEVLIDQSTRTAKGLIGTPIPQTPPEGPTRLAPQASLEEAVKSGDSLLVKTLLEQGNEPNKATSEGETPLTLAARRDSEEVVALLLRRGADPTLKNKAGRTPLDISVEQGHAAALRVLVAHTKDKAGVKLLEACRKDQEQVAKLLIEGGANVNARDEMGNTPLMLAVGMGKVRLVRALLAEGADVNAINEKGISVLGWAYSPVIEGEFSVRQRRQIVRLLKEYGAIPGGTFSSK